MKLVVIFALFALAIGKKKENSGKSMQKEGKEEGQGKIKIMEATICNLQTENEVLKRHVPTETLLQITVNTT